MLVAVESALIESYATDLRHRFASALNPIDVLDLAADVVQDDPIKRGLRRAEDAGYHLVSTTNFFEVTTNTGVSQPVALRVLSYFDRADRVAIRAYAETAPDDWTILVWQRPHLLVAGPATGQGRGSVYDLARVGPSALGNGTLDEVSSREVECYTPGQETGPIAQELLATCGVTRTG
jgi:hypothetical protein